MHFERDIANLELEELEQLQQTLEKAIDRKKEMNERREKDATAAKDYIDKTTPIITRPDEELSSLDRFNKSLILQLIAKLKNQDSKMFPQDFFKSEQNQDFSAILHALLQSVPAAGLSHGIKTDLTFNPQPEVTEVIGRIIPQGIPHTLIRILLPTNKINGIFDYDLHILLTLQTDGYTTQFDYFSNKPKIDVSSYTMGRKIMFNEDEGAQKLKKAREVLPVN